MAKGGKSKGTKSRGKGSFVWVPKGTSKGKTNSRTIVGKRLAGKGGGIKKGKGVVKRFSGKGGTLRKGKGVVRGKGKGKGKGKRKGKPPSLNSKFWVEKEELENRTILGEKEYTGTIQRYVWKHGYGFILPDSAGALPKNVKKKLADAVAAAEAAGKEVSDPNLLYFRKPDVNHEEGFKLAEDVPVTFKIYIDEKGAGACNVSQA